MGKYRAKMFLWWCLRYQYCYGDILCDILDIHICLWWNCCFRNILSCSFAIDMSWVNVLLWKCIGWQNCYEDNIVIGFSMEKILLWLMIWVKVLLWGCLKSILLWRWLTVLLWRWPGLQYCYRDAFGDIFATDTCMYDSLKTTWWEVWHFTLKQECLFLTLSGNDRLLGLH